MEEGLLYTIKNKIKFLIKYRRKQLLHDRLYLVLVALMALLLLFALIAQPDLSLITGFWKIQIGEAGLITDPMVVGGVGATLLNAALVLAVSTFLVWRMGLPCTGVTFACLFMMAGFAMLGKNLLNIAPIVFGGWLYSQYKYENFSKYVYLTLFGTCLAPMVSFLLNRLPHPWQWISMVLVGVLIGFLIPGIAGYTIRVHQGYNLYNVGFAAGFLGLGLASIMKGFGVEFVTDGTWSTEGHGILSIFLAFGLTLLLFSGMMRGCQDWNTYKKVLRHSGRAVADFVILDGSSITLVNMAATGLIGFFYLMALYPFGVRLNGPLVCCILSMVGFGAFGKHPKNVIPVMVGAVLSALTMVKIPVTAPGVLLATLLCTGLAPIAGQFGWIWGVVAGFVHMTIVQNTSILHGGMNLYNNGFSAGLVCVLLVPIIEALKQEPVE